MNQSSKGIFVPTNPKKYIGTKTIHYKSSWELAAMRFFDTNPNIQEWASESISIPYRDPLTNRQTIYVPDFLIKYIDRNGKIHIELLEIKPANQAILEKVGKNKINQALFIKNQAKWAQARLWAKANNITFRVLCEHDLFIGAK